MKILFVYSGVLLLLTACACPSSYVVKPIQKSDKQLSCKEVVLEINEVEHQRRQAESDKTFEMRDAFQPVCYPSTIISAKEAMRAAQERLDYLNEIYALSDCDRQLRANRPVPPPGIVIPPASVKPPFGAPPPNMRMLPPGAMPPPGSMIRKGGFPPPPPGYKTPPMPENIGDAPNNRVKGTGESETNPAPEEELDKLLRDEAEEQGFNLRSPRQPQEGIQPRYTRSSQLTPPPLPPIPSYLDAEVK